MVCFDSSFFGLCILRGTIKHRTANGKPTQGNKSKQQLVQETLTFKDSGVFKHRDFSAESFKWKRQFRKVIGRWEDTIEKDLEASVCDDGRWVQLAQDRI
jgi:hypothetical protein